ncbi:NAD(P)H-binding protein [Microbispora corallina]|uniref:Nucleotide-diphosphate-sugar epimerase n=1 Tax=Microbispora corallina TaxID=83302 RepID=A0ABQ4FT92_9ACTN|nr:NAD(P)H-binding protein [Microbispora corallina]GIH38035.1 nucleotide-diphosphate-sugar epimerase [Microbispora corallina]
MPEESPDPRPTLVTGAAGGTGGVGRAVAGNLLALGLPVRALVHRDDERARSLGDAGAEVVVGDLTRAADVADALDGCRRVYFAMSVSSRYLEATAVAAAAAREHGRLEIFVNMSQMTVSQMDLRSTAESGQQRLHWLGEQVLNWSGLPVAHLRPTVFMENPLFALLAAASIRERGEIRLPFGAGRTSPIAARDVADVVTAVLLDPAAHVGSVHELTGGASRDLAAVAAEFGAALGRPVAYVDVPFDEWVERDLRPLGLPEHLTGHLATMARLHRLDRYDRVTHEVEDILGRPPSTIRDFVAANPVLFA